MATLVGCAGTPAPSASPVATPTPTPAGTPVPSSTSADAIDGSFDVGGYSMWITCTGTGSPTVILDAGLNATSAAWDGVRNRVAATTRVCAYDRPGLGRSGARPDREPRSAGAMAAEAWRLFTAAGLTGPLVLVGHSYGGMIDRLLANDHPDAVHGLVLVDAGTTEKFHGDWALDDEDGATPVDRDASARELARATTLGDVPLVVLTQGQMSGDFVPFWAAIQDGYAALSTDSLHLIARMSDHDIPGKAAGLVVAAIGSVVEAQRSGASLPRCGAAFEAVGAECLASTMTAQVEAWQRLRDGVEPVAGSFPGGIFRSELSGADVHAMIGSPPGYQSEVLTWTFDDGRWSVRIVDDGGAPDTATGIYEARGGEVTFRLPDDWIMPRTPGVNRLRWSRSSDGAIHLTQIDDELPEPWFSAPLQPERGG